jgi:hypothetical protein
MNDAEQLLVHMGLTGDTESSRARLDRARRALPAESPARRLIDQAVTTAADNPFVQQLTGSFKNDVEILSRRLALAERSGDRRLAAEVLQDARVMLIATGTTYPMRGDKDLGSSDYARLRAARQSSPEAARLVDGARPLAEANPRLTPDERKALGVQRTPDPGFEARYTTEPAERPDVRPGRKELAQIETERNRLIALRDARETAGAPQKELDQIRAAINRRSEEAGMTAGRAFAEQVLKVPAGGEVDFGRQGSGLPDLIYELPGGRIVVVECKGGDADLGVRRSVDGTLLVQQGTHEYLRSLAREMSTSSNPEARRVGELLRRELLKPTPNIDYYEARQPFDRDTGRPLTPQIGKFDLSAGRI